LKRRACVDFQAPRDTGKQLDSDANGTIDRREAWVWDGQQVVLQLVDADGAGSAPWKLTNRYLYGTSWTWSWPTSNCRVAGSD